jgi:ribose transport system permease protein
MTPPPAVEARQAPAAIAPADARTRAIRWAKGDFAPIWAATIILFALSALFARSSLTSASVATTMALAAVLAIAAAGQTLVVQQRGLDLSVSGSITLFGMVLPLFLTRSGDALVVGLVVVAAGAALVGTVNGLLITRLSITPLIATLAVNSLLAGAVLDYSHGVSGSDAPQALITFAQRKFLGLSLVVWVAIVLVIAITLFCQRTVIGRRFVGVGANPATARAAGIPVNRYVVGAYIACQLCFALAAVLLGGYLGTTSVTTGANYLFPTIAAVVVGGTSFAGGRGSVIASAVAALFLTQLVNFLLALGAPGSTQLLAQAVAIAAAAGARSLTRR